ncbi:methyltransferase [Streptomyces sp. NPDC056149]|uniref:methyltransferase n=1 Tax=Streptomyces sp. NPDC056149 TaxID=3345728 RepID=UPI0035D6E20E
MNSAFPTGIQHDWPDEDCLRILHTLRRSMAPGTRLLVIDAVPPADRAPHLAIAPAVVMLMVLKGRERTAAECGGAWRGIATCPRTRRVPVVRRVRAGTRKARAVGEVLKGML